MSFFSAIPEAQGIIHAAGIYAQVPLYERGGKVYAKRGAGAMSACRRAAPLPPPRSAGPKLKHRSASGARRAARSNISPIPSR